MKVFKNTVPRKIQWYNFYFWGNNFWLLMKKINRVSGKIHHQ